MRALAFWAIIEDSWRESWARRTSIALAIIVLILLLLFAFGVSVREVEDQADMITVSLFGIELQGAVVPKTDFAKVIEVGALSLLNPWGIFLGLFITTGLFSGMLAKGRIDLLLSKPIARWELYLARYSGGLLLVLATTMLFCLGLLFLLWLKTGIADFGLIWAGLVVVFLFGVFYSFAALMAILTDGTGLSLVATLVIWGLAEFTYFRDALRALSPTLGNIADVIYYILPKTSDLELITTQLIGAEEMLRDVGLKASSLGFPLWTSALFGVAMLALGISRFSRRDY